MITINDLPAEILSHIFALTAFMDGCNRWSKMSKKYFANPGMIQVSLDRIPAPFVFLKVCGHWRAVAKSTPLLWNSLDASNYYYNKKEIESLPIEALQFYLSLSQSAPLDLHVNCPGASLPADRQSKILWALRDESHRWRTISLRTDAHTTQAFEDVIVHLLGLGEDALPNLQRLELDITLADKYDYTSLSNTIGAIKSLQELYFTSRAFRDPSYPFSGIQWGCLRIINISSRLTTDEIAFYLSQAKAAEIVTFTKYGHADPSASFPQHTTLSCLRSLTLTGWGSPDQLLDVFDFPNLERLEIRHDYFVHVPTSLKSLKGLIARSSCTLRSLLLDFDSAALAAPDIAEHFMLPRLQAASRALLICKAIQGDVEGISPKLGKDTPPVWHWQSYRGGMQHVGWKPEPFDERWDLNVKSISRSR